MFINYFILQIYFSISVQTKFLYIYVLIVVIVKIISKKSYVRKIVIVDAVQHSWCDRGKVKARTGCLSDMFSMYFLLNLKKKT